MSIAVAHKLACISSLAKPYSYKSATHEHARTVLQRAVPGLEVSLRMLAPYKAVRGKAVVLTHRLIASVGLDSLSAAEACLMCLLASSDEDELTAAFQLFNQVMAEFGERTLGFVERALGPVLDRLAKAYEAVTLGVGETEAAHCLVEREFLLRQYMLLIQHVMDHRCWQVLIMPTNYNRFQSMLTLMTNCVLGRENEGRAVTVTVRRCALAALISTAAVFTGDVDAFAEKDHSVQSQVSAFRHCLFDISLPALLTSLVDKSLNLKDALSVNLVGDIAVLLWTLLLRINLQELLNYILSLCSRMNWPDGMKNTLLIALKEFGETVTRSRESGHQIGGIPTAFKDRIKDIAKANYNSFSGVGYGGVK